MLSGVRLGKRPLSCDAKALRSGVRSHGRWGAPDAALSVWIAEQHEVTEDKWPRLFLYSCLIQTCQALSGLQSNRRRRRTSSLLMSLFLRHPGAQSSVWVTPPLCSQSVRVCHPLGCTLPWTKHLVRRHESLHHRRCNFDQIGEHLQDSAGLPAMQQHPSQMLHRL